MIFQGVLGGLRVTLDERTLAQLHGCVGPLFFALTVAIATFTSGWWSAAIPRRDSRAGGLKRLAIATAAIAYLQLVLGTFVRHVSAGTSPGEFRFYAIFHLIVAAVLTAHVGLLGVRVVRHFSDSRLLLRPALALVGLIGGADLLGRRHLADALRAARVAGRQLHGSRRYTVEAGSLLQTHVTTAHVAVGSLILGTSLALGAAIAAAAARACRATPRCRAQARWGWPYEHYPAIAPSSIVTSPTRSDRQFGDRSGDRVSRFGRLLARLSRTDEAADFGDGAGDGGRVGVHGALGTAGAAGCCCTR